MLLRSLNSLSRSLRINRRSFTSTTEIISSLSKKNKIISSDLLKNKTSQKHVHIIYTGGTIGMKKNIDGSLAPAPGFLPEVLRGIGELKDETMPTYSLSEWPTIYDSSDMGATQWNQIAREISEKYNDVTGFVILIGTDTMAYAASALSFMLKNTDKPIVFTGSSIPFGEVHSDARRNLIVSIAIAAFVDIPEVMIFFNEALLRGNRTRKKDSGGMDAFHSPKFPPLATLGVGLHMNEHLAHAPPKERFQIRPTVDINAAFVRVLPGYSLSFLEKTISNSQSLQAVILEMAHSNPVQHVQPQFVAMLRSMVEKDLCVILGSQCPVGRLTASSPATVALREMGVVFAGDMTMEAVATKLAYAYGRNLGGVREIRSLMETNIRGEITIEDFN